MQGMASVFYPGVVKIETEPLREVDCKADIALCWKAVGDYMRTAFGYIDNVIPQQTNDKATYYDPNLWSSTL